MSLQTLFFFYIVSEFSNTIIGNRLDSVIEYIKSNYEPLQIDQLKKSIEGNSINRDYIEELKKNRVESNIQYLLLSIGPLFIICLTSYILITWRYVNLNMDYLKIVGIILLSYISEILFFYIVVRRYNYIESLSSLTSKFVEGETPNRSPSEKIEI